MQDGDEVTASLVMSFSPSYDTNIISHGGIYLLNYTTASNTVKTAVINLKMQG